jgi:hypothetical protein
MPVRLGNKKYKKFGTAVKAIAKKKGIGKKRAAAYVAATERLIAKRRAAKHKRKK